jgi:two-component system, OmpR family, sensor histidine kinase KdpD
MEVDMTDRKIEGESASGGPVVAALGYDESGAGLVSAAAALARESGSELDCLTVDNGERYSSEEGERVAETQRLARGLGARVASEPDADVAAGLLRYASGRGAQAIVVGMSPRKLFGRSVLDRLLAAAPAFRIVAIGPARSTPHRARSVRSMSSPAHYFAAVLVIAAVTALNYLLTEYAGYWAAAIPYLAAISLMALALDRLPVVFAALLSALAWDILFIPPRFTIHISRTEDLLMLCLYFLVAVCSGWMTARLRSSERLLALRESRMSRLSALAQKLAGAKTIEAILDESVEAIKEAFSVEAIVILREQGGGLKKQAESGWEPLDAAARDAARISFEEMRSSGRFTDACPASEWHFVPLEGPRGCLGVLGLRAAHNRVWNEGLESFLRTMALTVSIAAARELSED